MAQVALKNLTGAILAGGRSRRFGSNKALARWEGGALIETVVERMRPLFPTLLILVKDARPFQFLEAPGIRILRDMDPESHPLAGIHTALAHSDTEYSFITACDMPFVKPEMIRILCHASCGRDAAIPIWKGVPQPLCGVYSVRCLKALREMRATRRFSVRDIFSRVETVFLEEREILRIDPQGLSFVDIDTPEDYKQAEQLILAPGVE